VKELRVTETRITIEGDGRHVDKALVFLAEREARAAVFVKQQGRPPEELVVLTSEQASALEQVFGRIRQHLDEHEKALAMKGYAGAGSNTSEQPPEKPAL